MAAEPWVILGRVLRAQHGAAVPDFSLEVAPPPRVAVLAAGRRAHPDPNRPDEFPYIIATGPRCVLAHFAVAPSIGTFFGDDPPDTHLVLVRHFRQRPDGLAAARAERVPDRNDPVAALLNIGSVGLISDDDGNYMIVDLQVDSITTIIGLPATLTYFGSGGDNQWHRMYLECPLPEAELKARGWEPHGAVSIDSTLWCFDLRWGILSCDLSDPDLEPDLLFHSLPDGRALDEATEAMFAQRCITVSQGQLRYVEIVPECGGGDGADYDDGEAATVLMWTRVMGPDGWRWDMDYSMSFEQIWNDKSYEETGLPRNVPTVALVCPSDNNLVYFSLQQRLFGVNVPEHRVVHHEAYKLMAESGAGLEAIGRFVLPWELPPAVAAGA